MMGSNWMLHTKRADFSGLAAQLHVDPVVIRILCNRGIRPEEMEGFLHPTLQQLHDPHKLKDADKAAGLLETAIASGSHIRVIGDYDIDGIFSTYILVQGLRRVGAEVSYDIPHRIEDGYGMNIRLVEQAAKDGVNVIVTCDNGIKALDEVKRAHQLGMEVIVTDHHELGFTMDEQGEKTFRVPEAAAVINPHQPGCIYPFPNICGATVAWKLVMVVLERYGLTDAAMEFLPYVAFATIGDIMPLRDENRSIVRFGLEALPGVENPGLQSLIGHTGLQDSRITPYHVGFMLGPCFNAAGRLDTAMLGVELLLEQDAVRAAALAESLCNLNDQRKVMTEEGTKQAIDVIEREGYHSDNVLVVYVSGLHESLAGIVAGRIKEKYYRPTFVLTDAKDGIKGSGRSIPGYPMSDKLQEVERLLLKYGGHPMAAGVSLLPENVDLFRRLLNENAGLREEQLTAELWIDVPMPVSYISEELIAQLSMLEPFGEGNPRPLFGDKKVALQRAGWIGKDKKFVKFTLATDRTVPLEALYFRDGEELVGALEDSFGRKEVDRLFHGEPSAVHLCIAYYPQVNEFRGRKTLQVMIEDYR